MKNPTALGYSHRLEARPERRGTWERGPAIGGAGPWAIVFVLFITVATLRPDYSAGKQPAYLPAWALHLRRVDEALARGDVRAAIRPWKTAYGAALKSQGWEGMAAVGAAYLRMTDRLDGRDGIAMAAARPIVAGGVFEIVFSRAQQQASLEGMLHAAAGFTALGDVAMADRCLAVSEQFAGRKPGMPLPVSVPIDPQE